MLQLGDIEIYSVSDGFFSLDGGAMFGVVPKPLWTKYIEADVRNRIRLGLNCLLLKYRQRFILVDTGISDGFSEKEKDIYAIDHGQSDIWRSLQALGLNAEDITDVVLTHLHFDHAGNVVRHKKTGPELGFPRATHHVQRRHLKWAEHASERDRVSFRDQDLQLLAKSGRLHLLDGDTEIFEGVDVLVSEGHTIGQQLLRVRGDDRVLLYCADVIPTTAHLPLAWVMGYDLYPLTTVEEKKTILAQALEEDWILAFEHDPRVLACSLQEQNGRVLPKDVIDL